MKAYFFVYAMHAFFAFKFITSIDMFLENPYYYVFLDNHTRETVPYKEIGNTIQLNQFLYIL